jgi:hypothetical protein
MREPIGRWVVSRPCVPLDVLGLSAAAVVIVDA